MDVGKLPPQLLQRLFDRLESTDPRVVLGPRTGEDAALIDFGDRLLVAKSDPITLASDLIGWYAVQVNANDVAVMGARPRWFLACMLLPEGASEKQAEEIFQQILDACKALDISLVGGHSEITQGLSRPIVVGAMLGEVERDKAVLTSGARPGDAVVLTKGIALEGSAVLAREAAETMRALGVPQETLRRAAQFLFDPGISVVHDALTCHRLVPVHAMHDPTEGGLAMALWEICQAADVGVLVEEERIPILPECRELCRAARLDPMGLLASGALLVTLPPEHTATLIEGLAHEKVPAWPIGWVTPPEEGLRLQTASGTRPLEPPQRDELARFFSSTAQRPAN